MKTFRGILACAVIAPLFSGCVGLGSIVDPPSPPPPGTGQVSNPPARGPTDKEEFKQPTPDEIARAFILLNNALREENEKILKERGTRLVGAPRAAAFGALQAGLVRLGMIVENRDPDLGVLAVAAPAPKPLDASEWATTVRTDTPFMGRIVCPVLGNYYCRNLKFDPEDFVIVINATVAEAAGGSEVSLTTRMREIAPRPGWPRREYPPPTGVHIALDKIWGGFDRALAERPGTAR